MRILLVSALLGLAASCAWPPPPAPTPPTPAVVAVPAPPPSPAVVVAAAPAPPVVDYVPLPLLLARRLIAPAPAGRLTLSNFTYDSARIQAVVTGGPDCAIPEGAEVTDFVLPLNGTRIIPTSPGADVCWRREMPPAAADAPPTPPWTDWNRAYTASGRSLDSRL